MFEYFRPNPGNGPCLAYFPSKMPTFIAANVHCFYWFHTGRHWSAMHEHKMQATHTVSDSVSFWYSSTDGNNFYTISLTCGETLQPSCDCYLSILSRKDHFISSFKKEFLRMIWRHQSRSIYDIRLLSVMQFNSLLCVNLILAEWAFLMFSHAMQKVGKGTSSSGLRLLEILFFKYAQQHQLWKNKGVFMGG